MKPQFCSVMSIVLLLEGPSILLILELMKHKIDFILPDKEIVLIREEMSKFSNI